MSHLVLALADRLGWRRWQRGGRRGRRPLRHLAGVAEQVVAVGHLRDQSIGSLGNPYRVTQYMYLDIYYTSRQVGTPHRSPTNLTEEYSGI